MSRYPLLAACAACRGPTIWEPVGEGAYPRFDSTISATTPDGELYIVDTRGRGAGAVDLTDGSYRDAPAVGGRLGWLELIALQGAVARFDRSYVEGVSVLESGANDWVWWELPVEPLGRAAVFAGPGTVNVLGGDDLYRPLPLLWSLDLDSGQWSPWDYTGVLSARTQAIAETDWEGQRTVVLGGIGLDDPNGLLYYGPHASEDDGVWRRDGAWLDSEGWHPIDAAPEALDIVDSVAWNGDTILALGRGKSVMQYELEGQWSELPSVPSETLSSTIVNCGRVLVIDDDTWTLDLETGTWNDLGPAPHNAGFAGCFDGFAYVVSSNGRHVWRLGSSALESGG